MGFPNIFVMVGEMLQKTILLASIHSHDMVISASPEGEMATGRQWRTTPSKGRKG